MWCVDGGTWEFFNPIGSWPRKQRVLIYGPNQVPVSSLNFFTIALLLLQNPIFIVQVKAIDTVTVHTD